MVQRCIQKKLISEQNYKVDLGNTQKLKEHVKSHLKLKWLKTGVLKYVR